MSFAGDFSPTWSLKMTVSTSANYFGCFARTLTKGVDRSLPLHRAKLICSEDIGLTFTKRGLAPTTLPEFRGLPGLDGGGGLNRPMGRGRFPMRMPQ